MSHDVGSQLPLASGMSLSERKKRLQAQLVRERCKLETMVTRQYEKGIFNLGSDIGILKQSNEMDKLLLDFMLLDNQVKNC
ncbi:MAG: hypothetical protein ACOX8N_02980 [Christensenellales bacterium]|jgi:hypothetical protein